MTTDNQPETLDGHSLDVAEERRRELLRLFPEVRTEGGKLDFDKLKLALGEAVDVGRERYGMNWPGKAECFRTIQATSTATLRPCREESVDFDTTQNLIIEGDNLEVLKLLQKAYLGKVKMIYIDPPYNTGNDFIYPDNYAESLQTYLEFTGQVDAQGRKFSTNTETDGRFHSKWLNMMYPRLYLARNLLREDGVIFISISDAEFDNLRRIGDELFGDENFIASLVWQKSKKGDAKLVAISHEYVVAYARNKTELIAAGKWRIEKAGAQDVLAKYESLRITHGQNHEAISAAIRDWYSSLKKTDPRRAHQHYRWSDDRGLYFAADFAGPDDGRDSRPQYDIAHPVTGRPCKKPSTGWRWEEARTQAALAQVPMRIHFGPDETTIPCRKSYLAEIVDEPFASVFYRDGRAGTLELERLLTKGLLEFPKDKGVLMDLVKLASGPDDLILDFFAGSGSSAHAVLELNATGGGNRKFLMVQLPEPTLRPDYPTIADICKARVRQVCAGFDDVLTVDGVTRGGFRVMKLADSNFGAWASQQAHTADELAQQLTLHVSHIRADRTDDDLLFEILLKSGYPPSEKIETVDVGGTAVASVAGGLLFICLARTLTLDAIRAMAERAPERVVCLDAAFDGNDQLKANAVQIFKSKGIVFKTV